MSINYTTLFTRIGKCVKWINNATTYQGTNILGAAPTGLLYDIMNQFDSRLDLVPAFPQTATGWANAVAGWGQAEKAIIDAVLGDLQATLNATNKQPTTILPLLYTQMVADSQTIQANTTVSATASAGGSNVGNGLLLLSVKNFRGGNDERIIPETVIVKCSRDQWGGGTAGAEQFSVTGQPKLASAFVSGTPGNGNGPTLSVADSVNNLANGNFATFAGNVPSSWTLDAGTAGTNVAQETVNVHSGTSALKLIGDGTTTTITLHQAINTKLSSDTIYLGSVWLRKAGTVTSGSTFKVQITGTGFGPFVLFNADPSTLTTSYVNYPLFWDTGATFPADAKVQITWTAANTAGASAIIDVADCVFVAPTAFGNVQYAIVRGSADFAVSDVFTVTSVNVQNGVFQTAFGRLYNFQLPSAASSPTIADSLAV